MRKILSRHVLPTMVSALLKLYVFLLFLLCKIVIHANPEAEKILLGRGSVLLVFWHGRILIVPRLIAKMYGRHGFAVVSQHKDGDYVAKFIGSYGHKAIRGSSRKGAIQALKGAINALEESHLVAITPDGPIGPRFKLNSNVCAIASKTGAPIISMSFAASRAKTLSTWDAFLLPLLFSTIYIYIDVAQPLIYKNEPGSPNSSLSVLEAFMCNQTSLVDELASNKQ